jgi:hypothetical protein
MNDPAIPRKEIAWVFRPRLIPIVTSQVIIRDNPLLFEFHRQRDRFPAAQA